MKHFSHFIKPGARLLETKGRWTSNSLVFENPDGQLVITVLNSMHKDRGFTFLHGRSKDPQT